MTFRNQGCKPAHVVVALSKTAATFQTVVDIVSNMPVPMTKIRHIDCELPSRLRNLYIGIGQSKLTELRIKRKYVCVPDPSVSTSEVCGP